MYYIYLNIIHHLKMHFKSNNNEYISYIYSRLYFLFILMNYLKK